MECFGHNLLSKNSSSLNRVRYISGSINRVHRKSSSSKLVHLESGSSKSVHQKSGSLTTVFVAMCIYPKLNLQLAGEGGFVAPAIIKWCYLIVKNLFKSVCLYHSFSFPVCAFGGFTSILYVLVRATSVRCRPPKTHSYPPKLRKVWVNPEFRMSQFDVFSEKLLNLPRLCRGCSLLPFPL